MGLPCLNEDDLMENILKTELFKIDDVKHKSKMTGDCCVLRFPQRSVDGEHLMRFQSETVL